MTDYAKTMFAEKDEVAVAIDRLTRAVRTGFIGLSVVMFGVILVQIAYVFGR